MISSNYYKPIIINRLNELGIHGEEFCDKLNEHKCLMAGSFPLQCLLGDKYEKSDIDVFIALDPQISDDTINHFPKNQQKFSTWLSHEYKVRCRPVNYTMKNIVSSKKFHINKKACVNIVLVDTIDLHKFILTDFDYTFCQTIFDGQKLQFWPMTIHKIGFLSQNTTFKEKQPYHLTTYEASLKIKKIDSSYKYHQTQNIEHDTSYDPNIDNNTDNDQNTNHNTDNNLQQINRIIATIYIDPKQYAQQRKEKYQSRGFIILDSKPQDFDEKDIKILQLKHKYQNLSQLYLNLTQEIDQLRKIIHQIKSN